MLLRNAVFVFNLLCGACIFPSSASALMLGLSTDKLTGDAYLIVTGSVEDTESHWTPDNKTIMTTALLSIREVLKGRIAGKKIQVMYPGGQVNGIGMMVSDEVLLHKGEQVLLFLSKETRFSGGAAFRISGRAQGKYTIGEDMIARKRGFSAAAGAEHIDNNLHIDLLKEKIRACVEEK